MNLEGDDYTVFKALAWRLLAVSEEYHNNLQIRYLLTDVYMYGNTLGIIFNKTKLSLF